MGQIKLMKKILILDPLIRDPDPTDCFDPQEFQRKIPLYLQEYEGLMESLWTLYGQESWWLSSPLASFQVTQSTAFLNYSYLRYAQELAEKYPLEKVVCSNDHLYRGLQLFLKSEKHPQLKIQNLSSSRTLRAFKHSFTCLRFLVVGSLRKVVISFLRLKEKPLPSSLEVLVETYLLQNSFSQNQFSDRYSHSAFEGYLQSKKWSYLAHIHSDHLEIQWIQKALNSSTSFIFIDELIPFKSRLKSFFVFLRSKRYGQNLKNPCLRWILEDIYFSFNSSQLLSHCLLDLWKNSHLQVRAFLNWGENQNVDKCLITAFKKNLPKTKIYTYLAYPTFSFYLNLIPKNYELKPSLIGDVILISYKKLFSELKQKAPPDIEVLPAPPRKKPEGETGNSQSWKVLICLNYDQKSTEKLLQLAQHLSHSQVPIELYVVPHPNNSEDLLKTAAGLRLLKQAGPQIGSHSILITGASSMAYEAEEKGAHILLYPVDNGLSILPHGEGMKLCFTKEDVQDEIKQIVSLSQKQSHTIKKHFFDTQEVNATIKESLL